uniref:Uncharacterized protein n=1 Tax=Panagrolaimus sp. JU765 TaxID=591449 RepID=A0AC34QDH6_9BILA
MKLLVFVGLCTIFVIISGFEYGKDKVRTACWYDTFWGGSTAQNYYHYLHGRWDSTKWVEYCPYENRIHFHCKSGNVDPNAFFEILFERHFSTYYDFVIHKVNLTHTEADGKSGYFDVYVGNLEDIVVAWQPWLFGYHKIRLPLHLYGKFVHPCNNVGEIRVGDLLLDDFTFE